MQPTLRHKILLELPPPTICKRCGTTEGKYSTRLNGKGKRYYNLTCIRCRDNIQRAAKRKKLREMSPEEAYRLKRHEQLRNKYKMSLEMYETMLDLQGGVCALCGLPETQGKALSVDHCHKTNKFRAILCHKCNKGLGQFMDNPIVLRKAADYIEHWNISHGL